jgi:thiol:disulfide interchange protein DsbD
MKMKNMVMKKRNAGICRTFILCLFLFLPTNGFSEGLDPLSHGIVKNERENTSSIKDLKIRAFPAVEDVDEKGDGFNVKIVLTIPDEYKLYADKTIISFNPNDNYVFGNLISPEPVVFEDPYLGNMKVYRGEIEFIQPVRSLKTANMGSQKLNLTVSYQGCSESGCFVPRTEALTVLLDGTHPLPDNGAGSETVARPADRNIEIPGSGGNQFQRSFERYGMAGVIIAAFLLGIAVSLTPCVYPMIPITVSVIGSGSSKNVLRGFLLSAVYVLGLSFTYAVFGTIAAVSGGLFGSIAGSPVARIVVAAVFILMALSMFDVFFIQMPNSISSKLQKISGSGFIGVFITGAVSGLIVGPCVGPPLVGLLAYIATLGSTIKGFFIMWSFALGLGMLFLVAGTFTGAISSLPKAGMWMEKVKYFFGIIMLGAALYFLSPLVSEKVLKIAVGGMLIIMGGVSGAFDNIGPDATGQSRLWKSIGIFFIVLGSGYIMSQVFQIHMPDQPSVFAQSGLVWHENESEALEMAKEQNKPVMLDFAADWCSACKRIEKDTFTHQKVIDRKSTRLNSSHRLTSRMPSSA